MTEERKVRHLDLFSGIGGFALAATWVWGERHEMAAFCEIDPFAQSVLQKLWPSVPIVADVREMDGARYAWATESEERLREKAIMKRISSPPEILIL